MTTFNINEFTTEDEFHFEDFGRTNDYGYMIFRKEYDFYKFMTKQLKIEYENDIEGNDGHLKKFLKSLNLTKRYIKWMTNSCHIEHGTWLEQLAGYEPDIEEDIEDARPTIKVNGRSFEYDEYEQFYVLKWI